MVLSTNIYSLEFWAQHQYLSNTDGSINQSALHDAFGSQAKTKFQAQLETQGFSKLPKPSLQEIARDMTQDEFMKMYEFGTPVRSYILEAQKQGLKLDRETLFNWVKALRPEKVEYGRNYSSVNVG